MRLISLLLVMLVILFALYKQLGGGSESRVERSPSSDSVEVPQVPARPQDVPEFKERMDDFMQDAAEERARKMEEAMGK